MLSTCETLDPIKNGKTIFQLRVSGREWSVTSPVFYAVEHSNPNPEGICQGSGDQHPCEEVQPGCNPQQ